LQQLEHKQKHPSQQLKDEKRQWAQWVVGAQRRGGNLGCVKQRAISRWGSQQLGYEKAPVRGDIHSTVSTGDDSACALGGGEQELAAQHGNVFAIMRPDFAGNTSTYAPIQALLQLQSVTAVLGCAASCALLFCARSDVLIADI
jgi:hypothetical protein